MSWVISLRDVEGAAEPRREHLAAHLAWVETVLDRILVAGPLRDASGATCGSLYVLDVADEAAARALLAEDPYFRAGVWHAPRIESFAAAAGRWVGGAAWKR